MTDRCASRTATPKASNGLNRWNALLAVVNIMRTEEKNMNYIMSLYKKRRGPRGISNYKGVCISRHGKWRAIIYKNGRQIYLGVYNTKEEAYKARKNYKNKF
jgi:hypothetical protein